ncbi:MAG TPA: hypothetical protein VF174_16070 [Micromonosporaceae bacterium]
MIDCDAIDDSEVDPAYTVVDLEDLSSWHLPIEFLESTGECDPGRAGPRYRPVIPDGTLVRIRESARLRGNRSNITGARVEACGLYFDSPLSQPVGYLVRLPGTEDLHLVFPEEIEQLVDVA